MRPSYRHVAPPEVAGVQGLFKFRVRLVADAQDGQGSFGFDTDCPGGFGDIGRAEDF